MKALHVIATFILGISVSGCNGSDSDSGPIDITNGAFLEGSLEGAPYRISVPPRDSWNGTLVIYAHGYRDKARVNLEEDDRSVDAAPGGAPLEELLVANGYAIAGTAYSDNGWAVEPGIQDLRNLTEFFNQRIGKADRTIVNGFSMGSIIALKGLETAPDLYDGVIAACSVGAGTTRNFDLSRAFLTSFDVAFGMPPAWGRPEDVNDDLDFENDVAPFVIQALNNPANRGKFEFIRLVNGVSAEGFYSSPGFLLTDFFFATEARAEIESRSGGAGVQNLTHTYTLLPQEKAYLATLGINADALLQAMNAQRGSEVSSAARGYLATYADFSGSPTGPVLSMHTRVDGFVLPGNQLAYQQLVASTGNSAFFSGVYTSGVGHCAFTGEQIVRSVEAMNFWLAFGTPPPAAFFPESAGFLPNFAPRPLVN